MILNAFIDRAAAPIPLDAAVAYLGNEPEGLAIDFLAMRMFVRDRTTLANNYLGDPNGKLTYTSPSPKIIADAWGQMASGTAIRCDHDAGTLDASASSMHTLNSTKTLTIAGSAAYAVGQDVRITLASDISKWMLGRVTAWNAGTKALTFTVYASTGYFSASSWRVIVAFGVYIEQQRTNILPVSCDRRTNWTANTAMTGFLSGIPAYSLLGGNIGSQSFAYNLAVVAGTIYTISAIIEEQTSVNFSFGMYNAAWIGLANYNWSSNAVTLQVGALFDKGSINLGIGPNGGRLRRVWAAITADASANRTFYTYPNGVTAVTTSTIMHHMQIEAGSFPTTPIVTLGAGVTRAADNITLPITALPFSTTAGAFVAEINQLRLPAPVNGDYTAILGFGDNTSSNFTTLVIPASYARLYFRNPSVGNNTPATQNLVLGTNKLACGWDATSAGLSLNGGGVATLASPALSVGMTRLGFGRTYNSSGYLDGHIKRTNYRPRRPTDLQLQGLAA